MWLHRRAAHLLLFLLSALGGLLPSRGEAAGGTVPGLPCPTPQLVKELASGAGSSSPGELVEVGGTLYFAATDGLNGQELWRSDGTEAGTWRVKNTRPWPLNASLASLTAAGGKLFFMVSVPGVRAELWRSDGTDLGTELLMSFPPQTRVFEPEFIAMGGQLFFVADASGSGIELWKSDGTIGGTQLVQDISSGDSRPTDLTLFNGALFFSAEEDTTGTELWMTTGTVTTQVKDLWAGLNSGGPSFLTVMGGSLYFFATDGITDQGLWRSDGTPAGTVPIPSPLSDGFHNQPANLTAAGNTLFFVLEDDALGTELWRSDGTEMGTRMVKDIVPGGGSAFPEQLTPVGETLFFTAMDGSGRRGLWRSDGTEAGTWRVRNFLPEVASPSTLKLTPGPGVLLAEVDDQIWGSELWKIDGTGAYRLTDISPGSASSSPREMTISGNRLFFAATHPNQGEELFALPLHEVDCYAPALQCPGDAAGDQLVEATSPLGAWFSSPPAAVSDDALTGLSVSYSQALQGLFPLGDTVIQIEARDAAGNLSQCSTRIRVQDTQPPLLLCPPEVRQEATSTEGATVHYFVGVSDAATEVPAVSASPASGSAFGMGTTSVTVSATDGANHTSTCTFPVIVQDTVAPRLTCPRSVVRIAESAEPIAITYEISAEDALSTPEVSISHPSGSLFPVGETLVTVTARDEAGHTSECIFVVNHLDAAAPTITCPGPQQAVASEPEGARVDFPEATAMDNLGPPTVSYSHEPGGTFAVGETIVTATAHDLGGNTASCTFPVTVVEGEGSGSGCGCRAGASGGSLGWLLLGLLPLWVRRRAARLGR